MKTAVITGSTRGLGFEMAKEFRRNGWNVMLNGMNAERLGLNMYGTSKRAVTHFTVALAKELDERQSTVRAGRLSPGIMATDFLTNASGAGKKIDLPDKTKRFYNIVAETPDVVAQFFVKKMLMNPKNNVHIKRLTTGRLLSHFVTALFRKRDYFAQTKA